MSTAVEMVKAFPKSTEEIREDVLPYMPEARAKVAAARLNTVEKRVRQIQLLDSSVMDWQMNQEEERRIARRKIWAEYHALKETETVNDLTPERKEQLLKRAADLLPQIDWAWAAYSEVRAIEDENLCLEKPSRTQEILKERYEEKRKDAADYLSFTASPEDIHFLNTLSAKRYRRCFRIIYPGSGCRPLRDPSAFIDLPIGFREFKDLIEHKARTLADVKQLLSTWSTPFRVERRFGGSVVVTDRFEIRPEEGV